jgi:uncharacterized protein YkwD
LLGVALASLVLAVPGLAARGHDRATLLDGAIVAQMNAVRTQAGLHPLRISGDLVTAARGHSLEMSNLGYFSHASADGGSMADRVRSSYSSSGKWMVGENLLWSSPGVTGARAVSLWMASPEHRANILTPGWKDVGCVSVHNEAAPGAFDDLSVTVVTCDFGVRS